MPLQEQPKGMAGFLIRRRIVSTKKGANSLLIIFSILGILGSAQLVFNPLQYVTPQPPPKPVPYEIWETLPAQIQAKIPHLPPFSSTSTPRDVSSTTTPVAQQFLDLAGELTPLSFNTTIFTDPRFTSLVDLLTPIQPEVVGRIDPFAPYAK